MRPIIFEQTLCADNLRVLNYDKTGKIEFDKGKLVKKICHFCTSGADKVPNIGMK